MSFTFFHIIANSSLFFKLIIIWLVILLVWSIGLFIEKFGFFKLKMSLSESFKREFNSGEMLDKIYNRLAEKKKIYSPLARIFHTGMKELNMSNIRAIDFSKRYADNIKKNIRDRIYSSMSIERAKVVQELKKDLSTFVIISTITPLFGILGSVWEIMYTFYTVNAYKVVNLSLIIPGIAQSLISIIFSLFVTVLAVYFYNFLISKLNYFIEETEIFACDLTNILARELDMLTNNATKRALENRRPSVDDDDDDEDDI